MSPVASTKAVIMLQTGDIMAEKYTRQIQLHTQVKVYFFISTKMGLGGRQILFPHLVTVH